MPYKEGEVPSGAKNVPTHGQAIYRAAFNAAYKQYGEARAHAIAWAAVKKKYKKKGDTWVSKDADSIGWLVDIGWTEEARQAARAALAAKQKGEPGTKNSRMKQHPDWGRNYKEVHEVRSGPHLLGYVSKSEGQSLHITQGGGISPSHWSSHDPSGSRTGAIAPSKGGAVHNLLINATRDAAMNMDKEFSTERRKELAKSGKAMPHGGYPIENEADLKNAIRAFGRAKNKAATKAWIKKRARALGKTELLPENWDALPIWGSKDVIDAWMDDEPSGNFTCPECHGTGIDPDYNTPDGKCDECEGTGYIKFPLNSSRKEAHETFPMRQNPNPDLRTDRRRRDDEDDEDEDMEDSQTVKLTDAFVMDAVRKTKDGYLVANARIARTGIQIYKGDEIGKPDMDVVRVYRSAKEVFDKKAMHSLAHKPITLLHPPEMVDSVNWDQYAVGHTGDEVARDGECVRVPMVIMDAQAIKAFEKYGVKELSVGYSCDLKWGKGTSPDGQVYDAKQTAIRGNHLAVVPAARGGSRLSIGDDRSKGGIKMVQVLIGDRLVSFEDEAEATHVTAFIKAMEDARKKKDDDEEEEAGESAKEEQEEEKKLRAEKDAAIGEIAALKKQLEDALNPAAREKSFKDSMELRLKAQAVMDGKVDFSGKTDDEIRRIVVASQLGDELAKTFNDGEIAGAFKAITANVKLRTGVDRLADSLSLLNSGGGSDGNNPKAIKDAAYGEYVKTLTSSWRTPART